MSKTSSRVILFLAVCMISSMAVAQNNRTAVSITGTDLATCTVPDPCRTFQVALSRLNSGGEVVALTSGGYGPFIVDRSATVLAAPGVHAGLVASAAGQSAISVDPGAGGKVVIRGLTMTGFGTGGSGVAITSTGAETHIENCIIDGFDNGVFTFLNFTMTDSTVRNCANGFWIDNAGGPVKGNLERVLIKDTRGGRAVLAWRNSTVTVRHSAAIGNNTSIGFEALQGGRLFVENSISVRNATGIFSTSLGTVVRMSNCVVTDNNQGVVLSGGGVIETFSNNKVRGNVTDVVGTLTAVPQN